VTNAQPEEPKLVKVYTEMGQLRAQVIKTRLESEGIPVLLRYDSASIVFALTVDGLGKVDILVPEPLAERARAILAEPAPLPPDAD
jgi:hypothetical protein